MPDITRIGADAAGAYQRAQRPVHDATRAARAASGAKPETSGRPDAVSVSTSAQELRQIVAAVQAAPEVRADLVARLQAQIQAGTYQLPSDETLAEALLRGG